ncbi:hypothetical protein HYV57_05800 [Candidatus Peregrinibacteria bacterium]|nr:hypothetical protein [Candidatus Peregrinibacteria bacterium]
MTPKEREGTGEELIGKRFYCASPQGGIGYIDDKDGRSRTLSCVQGDLMEGIEKHPELEGVTQVRVMDRFGDGKSNDPFASSYADTIVQSDGKYWFDGEILAGTWKKDRRPDPNQSRNEDISSQRKLGRKRIDALLDAKKIVRFRKSDTTDDARRLTLKAVDRIEEIIGD